MKELFNRLGELGLIRIVQDTKKGDHRYTEFYIGEAECCMAAFDYLKTDDEWYGNIVKIIMLEAECSILAGYEELDKSRNSIKAKFTRFIKDIKRVIKYYL